MDDQYDNYTGVGETMYFGTFRIRIYTLSCSQVIMAIKNDFF